MSHIKHDTLMKLRTAICCLFPGLNLKLKSIEDVPREFGEPCGDGILGVASTVNGICCHEECGDECGGKLRPARRSCKYFHLTLPGSKEN